MNKLIFMIIVVFVFCFPVAGFCQDETAAKTEEEKLVEKEEIEELERLKAKPVVKKFDLKFGGWFTTTFRDYTDTDNDSNDTDLVSWSLKEDLRLWSRLTFLNDYFLYLKPS